MLMHSFLEREDDPRPIFMQIIKAMALKQRNDSKQVKIQGVKNHWVDKISELSRGEESCSEGLFAALHELLG
jgi:hypothetical protein